MSRFIYSLIFLLFYFQSFSQLPDRVTGRVLSSADQQAISMVTVQLKDSKQRTITNEKGQFSLQLPGKSAVLIFTVVGYKELEVRLNYPYKNDLEILLQPITHVLDEVQISTGYQKIGITKTTGSFSVVTNDVLNLKVGTGILDRLQDAVSGLIFNRNNGAGNNTSISIRGQSTLYANTEPLIVIDNFPYEGDINSLNPDDVDNITVLKDAAAASIWGARAGNGVIVITTKKGKYNVNPQIAFNTSITSGSKPNLLYHPIMSSSDFIDVEESLFKKGYFKNIETSANKAPLSPAVELFIAGRDGLLGQADLQQEIGRLKSYDLRNDLKTYFYRRSFNQQYGLSISGGSQRQRYYLSAGLDQNSDHEAKNDFNRVTVNSSTTYTFFKQKLELTAGIYYTQSKRSSGHPGNLTWNNGQGLYPYAKLADENGYALPVVNGLRLGFINDLAQKKLLSWEYRPLDELRLANNVTESVDYRINTDLKYNIIPGMNATVFYQYGRSTSGFNGLKSLETFYVRNLINSFTIANKDGSLIRPIPLGGILDHTSHIGVNQNLRAQVNYNKLLNSVHNFDLLIGGEIRNQNLASNNYRLYGYDEEHELSSNVDYISNFTMYYNPSGRQMISNPLNRNYLTDRFISYFSNASYTFREKYIVTLSARIDRSNLFGVSTNQKGVPLYSLGAAWNLSDEQFYHLAVFPYLKLRATYGYNGNIDKRLSAYTTAYYYNPGMSQINKPYAEITNPPNPELRWEKVRITNLGVDFGTAHNRVTGTVDLYVKKGVDLIGSEPFAPSTGISTFRGNTATTRGSGIDLTLNIKNIDQRFKWNTGLIMSYEHEKVIKYEEKFSGRSHVQTFKLPIKGRPYNAIYSYPWAGLDPETGDPRGYLEGEISKDYAKILNAATPENIILHGSMKPTFFGSLRNTFNYDQFALSVNISYRLGYYFRKPTVRYSTVLTGSGGHGDYALRWQKPGDEQHTNVPSIPSNINADRDNFYMYSSSLVERGDHIRLNDIHLSYKYRFIQFYVYINNVGIIWKKTASTYDPDYIYSAFPATKTVAAGLKMNF